MEEWNDAIQHADSMFDGDFFFLKKGMKEEEIVALSNSQYRKNLDPKEIVEAKHTYF